MGCERVFFVRYRHICKHLTNRMGRCVCRCWRCLKHKMRVPNLTWILCVFIYFMILKLFSFENSVANSFDMRLCDLSNCHCYFWALFSAEIEHSICYWEKAILFLPQFYLFCSCVFVFANGLFKYLGTITVFIENGTFCTKYTWKISCFRIHFCHFHY